MDRILTWLAALALLISPASTALAQIDLGPDHRNKPIILTVDRVDDPPHTFERRCWDKKPNDCTLRDAVLRANQDPLQVYRIIVPPGTYNLTIPGEEAANLAGDLDLHGAIEMVGAGSDRAIISAGGIDRVLQVHSGAKVRLSGLTLRDGQAAPAEPGGGVWNGGSLELSDVVITHNRAGDGLPANIDPNGRRDGGAGGGIYSNGTVRIENCVISDNQAGGGAISTELPDEEKHQTGGAGGNGGGISNNSEMSLISSLISNNQAGIGGDGAGSGHGEEYYIFDLDYGDDAGNGGDGGGISNQGSLKLEKVNITGNNAGQGGHGGAGYWMGGIGGDGGNGGGVYNVSNFISTESVISNNQAGFRGVGGVSYFGNRPYGWPGSGGGVHTKGFASLTDGSCEDNSTPPMASFVDWGTIEYRTGPGGCIFNLANGEVIINDVRVNHNEASGFGGGIANEGHIDITGGEINHNSSMMGGGGIYNHGELSMSQSTLSENATGPGYKGKQFCGYKGWNYRPTDGFSPDGGGFYNQGSAKLASVDIHHNTTGEGGMGGGLSCGGNDWPLGNGAPGGRGAGIFNTGVLEIDLGLIRANQTGRGGQAGTSYFINLPPGLNGPGGSGGGVYNSGKLAASYLTIQDNGTGAGFSESEPGGAGGGIANVIWAGIENSFELRDSLVQGNRTSPGGAGGGIAMTGTITDTTVMLVSSSQVISNTASASGGGLALVDASARLESLIVASNHITDTASGAGLYIRGPETIVDPPGLLHSQARHLTIAGNQGGDGSGLYDLWANMALTDTILAGQPVGVVVTGTTTLTMTNTLWGREAWANGVDWLGAGTLVTDTLNLFDDLGFLDPLNLFDDLGFLDPLNLFDDPRFLDPPNLDFHLQPGSPAIDHGIDKFPPLDVDAQPRPDATSQLPDIGADELWALVPLSGAEIIPPAVITATAPASFGLVLAPADVAPAPRCFWLPAPETGQWACDPTLVFPNPGEQSLEVWVLQGGSPRLHLQTKLAVQPLWRNLYLPLAKR